MQKAILRSAACVALLAATLAQAAPDPDQIAKSLVAAAAATEKVVLTYDTATASGENVIISGLHLILPAGGAIEVPALIITDPVVREAGGFTAARIAFDAGAATSAKGGAKWRTAVIDDVTVPSPEEVKTRAKIRPFRQVSLGGVSISDPHIDQPIEIAMLTVGIGEVSEHAPADIVVRATDARVPATIVTHPIGSAMLAGLGYDEFQADLTVRGTYDTEADTVTVQSLTIDAAKVGRIAMTAKFSGLSFRGLADPEEAAAARAAARLDRMSVRFEDAGIVQRLLDMQAGMLGGSTDEVRAQLVYGALPFALSFVDNEGFRDQFLIAAAAFLEEPRSLTITAAPLAPVPLGQVWRTAVRTPLALPDLLTPDVVANN